MIRFALEGVKPVPQGSMRHIGNGRMIHNKAKELTAYRTALGYKAQQVCKNPSTEPISIRITFGLVKPKSVTRPMPTTYPDVDKLVRAVLDSLTGVVYVDDSQVVELTAIKVYSAQYLTEVEVEFGAFNLM